MSENNQEFAMERRLRSLDPALHRRFTDAVFCLQNILSNYKLIFPAFTDHTELHSLSVIDFSNHLIGDQLEQMNADELYVMLMACYFHDTGMGVSRRDFEEFSREIDFGTYFDTHSREDYPAIIRDFHNDYSGLFIRKYAPLFEIPSEAHLNAVIQIARGHRKTSLLDETLYPIALPVPGGHKLCLPYLTALIRLADEIDVTSARNSSLLYDMDAITEDRDIFEFKKHLAIPELRITEDAFTVVAQTEEPRILEGIHRMRGKMQHTLDECREAVLGRTPYVITQKRVLVCDVSGRTA